MSDVFDIGPYKGRIDVDFEAILKQWQEWSKKCKNSKGADIGVMSKNKSLYVFLKNHGVVGRKVITDKKKNTKEREFDKTAVNGNRVITLCEELFGEKNLSPDTINGLIEIQGMLEEMSQPNAPNNPKNMANKAIVSWSPSPKMRNGEPVLNDDGTPVHELDHQTVFGHYRTTEYVQYRREILGKDEPDADPSFYTEGSPGDAKPPMWQALFGDGTGSLKFKKPLKTVIDEAISTIRNAEVEILSSTPVKISGKGAGEAAYNQISEIKEWFDSAVRDPAYRTPNGNFSTTRAQTFWKNNYITLDDESEQSVMKQIMETVTADYPLDITSVSVYFPRNQILRIIRLAGFEPPAQKTEQNDGLVEKMDWRMVLAR